MHRTAPTLAAVALVLWALVGINQQSQPQPAAAALPVSPVTAPAAPAAPSALGDLRTLSRYPGN